MQLFKRMRVTPITNLYPILETKEYRDINFWNCVTTEIIFYPQLIFCFFLTTPSVSQALYVYSTKKEFPLASYSFKEKNIERLKLKKLYKYDCVGFHLTLLTLIGGSLTFSSRLHYFKACAEKSGPKMNSQVAAWRMWDELFFTRVCASFIVKRIVSKCTEFGFLSIDNNVHQEVFTYFSSLHAEVFQRTERQDPILSWHIMHCAQLN